VRWTFTGVPDQYWCTLTLDRPRLNARGAPFHSPQAPDTGSPGTPPTAPTTDYFWTFYDRGGTDELNLYDDGTDTETWTQAGWLSSEEAWWGGSGMRTLNKLAVTAGTTYTFLADVKQNATNAAVWLRVEWYTGGTLLQTDYIAGPGVSLNAYTSYSKVITAPTGATSIYLRAGAFRGKKGTADNIYIKHGGTGGTAGVESTSPPTTVGGTGQGTYSDSGQYVPVGSVLEHSYITEGGPYHDADQIAIDDVGDHFSGTDVEAALAELAAGTAIASGLFVEARNGGKEVINVVPDAGATYTVDAADGNFHDLTLTEDLTLSLASVTSGVLCTLGIRLRGAFDTTWPASVKWPDGASAPSAPDADGYNVVVLQTTDGGSNWDGTYGGSTGAGVTFGTPALTLGTANAAGSTDEAIRRDATILAFDATAPVTQAYSDVAATGSAAVAARRDHRHGMPASGSGIGEILISDSPSTPLVFGDLLQNEAQDDLLYADP